MRVTIKTDFAAARALIARADKAADDPAVADAVGIAAANRVRLCFRAGKDPWGKPWPKLKRPSRKRGGASAKPLRDTGRLRNSIRYRRAASSSAAACATPPATSSAWRAGCGTPDMMALRARPC